MAVYRHRLSFIWCNMKKITFFIICLLLIASVLSSCGSDATKNASSVVSSTATVAENYDSFRGTWSIDDYTRYYFDGSGKGSLILPDDTYAFSYKINGNTVELDFESAQLSDSKYEFTVQKDKMILKGKKPNEGTYKLEKTD